MPPPGSKKGSKLAKPEGPPPPCPRCAASDSGDIKFAYYNNAATSGTTQPRYYCKVCCLASRWACTPSTDLHTCMPALFCHVYEKACHMCCHALAGMQKCQRHWTHGGLLRKVEAGAGKRSAHRKKLPPLLDGSQLDTSIEEGVRARPRRCRAQRSSFAYDDSFDEDASPSPHAASLPGTGAEGSAAPDAARHAASVPAPDTAAPPTSAAAPSLHAVSSPLRRPTPAGGSVTGGIAEVWSPSRTAGLTASVQHSAPAQPGALPEVPPMPSTATAAPHSLGSAHVQAQPQMSATAAQFACGGPSGFAQFQAPAQATHLQLPLPAGAAGQQPQQHFASLQHHQLVQHLQQQAALRPVQLQLQHNVAPLPDLQHQHQPLQHAMPQQTPAQVQNQQQVAPQQQGQCAKAGSASAPSLPLLIVRFMPPCLIVQLCGCVLYFCGLCCHFGCICLLYASEAVVEHKLFQNHSAWTGPILAGDVYSWPAFTAISSGQALSRDANAAGLPFSEQQPSSGAGHADA